MTRFQYAGGNDPEHITDPVAETYVALEELFASSAGGASMPAIATAEHGERFVDARGTEWRAMPQHTVITLQAPSTVTGTGNVVVMWPAGGIAVLWELTPEMSVAALQAEIDGPDVNATVSAVTPGGDLADGGLRVEFDGSPFAYGEVGSVEYTGGFGGTGDVTITREQQGAGWQMAGGRQPRARLRRAAAQSIPTGGSGAPIAWDTILSDAWNMADGGEITLSALGVWRVDYEVRWATHATGYRQVQIVDGAGAALAEAHIQPGSTAYTPRNIGSQPIYIPVDATTTERTIRLDAYQTSGGALNIEAARLTVALEEVT